MDKPLKVLMLGMTNPPETFLVRLINGLASSGIEITINSENRMDFTKFHPTVLRVPKPMWPYRSTYGLLRKQVFSNFWDVIYFPWNSTAIQHLDLLNMAIPSIVSCRGSQVKVAPHNPKRSDIKEGLRRTFEKAAAVHCVSEDLKIEAMKYGLDPAKCFVIRPAVDTDLFIPSEKSSDQYKKRKIVSVGGLNWKKSYDDALQALSEVIKHRSEIEYHIIGEGAERQHLNFLIDEMGLRSYVTLRGRLDPASVLKEVQDSDIYIQSSVSEGISNAMLEAMSCGVAVVATDAGGTKEAIKDGQEGLLTPVRDPLALSKAIITLLNNPELSQKLGEAGRKRASIEFRLDQQIAAFNRMLQSVVTNN
jgi:colanic acid/amylovoran biosynthesis glycosyltransferase